MNRQSKIVNRQSRRAFTLIELLVVIAIIAILAAILFPVFAQAKAAAKASAGLSNVKQLTLGAIMYAGDVDDNRVERAIQDRINCDANGNNCTVTNEHSWKELITPYVKSTALFSDPQNVANKIPDYHSDTVSRASFGWTPTAVPANLVFPISYHLTNLQIARPPSVAFCDLNKAVSMTMFDSPATTGFITEGHTPDADTGPYVGWTPTMSGYTGNLAPLNGLYANGGDSYGKKAANAGYLDGHAKRTTYSAMDCTAYNSGATGTTPDFWNITGADLAINSWESNCTSLPAAFK